MAVTSTSDNPQKPSAILWSSERRGLTFGLTIIIASIAFESLSIATVLPAIVRDLGGIHLYGWSFSTFMLAKIMGIAVSGAEADRHGPAKPFLVGIALFIIGLLIAGNAPSMMMLIVGRFIQGFGGGTLFAMAYVCVSRAYPESVRPTVLATFSSCWVIPGLIGPALAGFIGEHLGWRVVFYGLVPLPLLAAVLASRAMRKLDLHDKTPVDRARMLDALRLAVGSGMVVAGLQQKNLMLLAALVALGAILAVPSLNRMLPQGSLIAAKGVPAAIALLALLNFSFFGSDAFVPLSLNAVRGLRLEQAGLTLTAATLCWTTGAWTQARFSGRVNRRKLIGLGIAVATVGIIGTGAILNPNVPVWLSPVFWGMTGLGMGIAYSTTALIVLEFTSLGKAGAGSAALQLANTLGVAIGTGIGGVIVGHSAHTNTDLPPVKELSLVFTIMAVALMGALLISQRIPAYPPRPQN